MDPVSTSSLTASCTHVHTHAQIQQDQLVFIVFLVGGGFVCALSPFHHVQPFVDTDVDDEVLMICGFLFSAPQSLW